MAISREISESYLAIPQKHFFDGVRAFLETSRHDNSSEGRRSCSTSHLRGNMVEASPRVAIRELMKRTLLSFRCASFSNCRCQRSESLKKYSTKLFFISSSHFGNLVAPEWKIDYVWWVLGNFPSPRNNSHEDFSIFGKRNLNIATFQWT